MDTVPPQTILIVDDDPTNLRVAVDYLRAYSYRILIARDGQSGIERAIAGDADLVLLDAQMPGIDGFETCRRMRANPALESLPVIFMTALSRVEDKVAAFEAGAVDFVTKPVHERELLARVEAHLRIRALQGQIQRQADALRASAKATAVRLKNAERAKREQMEHIQLATRMWLRDVPTGDVEGLPLELLQSHLAQARDLTSGESPDSHGANSHLTIALELLAHLGHTSNLRAAEGDNPFHRLTSRELEIVQLSVCGMPNKAIAFELGLAPSTISTHRKRILERLELTDMPALVRLALMHGIGG